MAADYLNYVLSNPDLRENAEALGLTQAEMVEWGKTHWTNHGEAEGRQNNPNEIAFEAGYTETLGAQHYQGRDPNEVLQRSVRANYQGADADDTQMWEARENIANAWNLGQYTSEGWNLAPDSPYRTGILGNTIEVNPDIGQLVPTTAAGNVGDLRFLQDRYVDEAIANDFPVGWTTPENTWAAAAPQQLGNYWDVLTNAVREDGVLRRVDPYDPATAVGPSVSPGTRGGGNVRPDRGGAGYGGPLIGGPPNPTVPSFGYPQYQDWTRFMPTNFQLAEGGGMHYQPGAYGIPQGGGNFVARPDPTMTNMGVYPGGSTTATGVPNVTYTPTNIWGDTTTGGNVTTDTSGKQWVMSPGGQWYPADSDYGEGLLGTGRLFYDQHYDSSGNYVGAESAGVRSDQIYDSPDPATRKAVGWGGGAYTDEEIASGIAGPDVTRYDQWGNEVDMGSRQVGLNILGPTMFRNNYKSAVSTTPSILGTQPAIGPINFSQNFTTTPGTPGYPGTGGYVDPGTVYGESFGGTYEGPDTDVDPMGIGVGSGLWT